MMDTVMQWAASREYEERELIPCTWPSSYDNYLKSIFRSVTYSVAIYRLNSDRLDGSQTYPKLDRAVDLKISHAVRHRSKNRFHIVMGNGDYLPFIIFSWPYA